MEEARSDQLNGITRLYIAMVACASLLCTFLTLQTCPPHFTWRLLLYICLGVAGGAMKVPYPGGAGTFSVNTVAIMLGLLELDVPSTLILAVIAAGATTNWQANSRSTLIRRLVFNTTSVAIATAAAGWALDAPWLQSLPATEFLRLVVAGLTFFVVNTSLLAKIIALTKGDGFFKVWKSFSNWTLIYYLIGAALAELMHIATEHLGWSFTLALLPLLYGVYRSCRVYFEKLEQQKAHAQNMAALHLRTIEALAMAIEAKDECTHDHLRRVQVYSLELGKELGLHEEQMLALEAASILHDIGKLAVPDYIISKPGKLTPEEFAKMKVHTVVGADILEQVSFPYPVAPIVRSHHEKWDGSGYPDGLEREQIPIGARILSAVDCLDALASDRQYRRALPLDDAMDYVASLSGRSFDPKVVAILKDHYRAFEQLAQSSPAKATRLRKDIVVTRGEAPDAGFEKNPVPEPGTVEDPVKAHAASVASARREMQTILELAQDVGGTLRPEELLSLVAERLKHIVPYDCIAVYVRQGDVLKPRYVNGENSRAFSALQIPIGQGLSGWVVENGKPIINGNPSVEPGYLKDPSRFSVLNSALSIPLRDGVADVTGALTLYRADKDAYSREHLRILLSISDKFSRAVDFAVKSEPHHQANKDELTGLPNADSLYSHFQKELARCGSQGKPMVILSCDLDGFKQVNDRYGHINGDELLKRVAAILQSNCRSSDYVARMGGDEFVVILSGAQASELTRRIDSLDRMVRAAGHEMFNDDSIGISIGMACFPEHGADVDSLLSYADEDVERAKRARRETGDNVLQLARSIR